MPDLPLNGAGHLPEEALYGYEHRLLTGAELKVVHDHVASCPDCRARLAARLRAEEAVADVRSSLGVDAPRAAPIRWWAAVAAALVAAAGGLWWAARSARPVSTASGDADEARVRAVLRSGRLPLPGFVKDLAPPRETLMGEAPAPSAPRLSPDGTAVLSGAPRLSWSPLPGAGSYRVTVFSLAGEPVAASPGLSATEWTPDAPLPSGRNYQWQVEAQRGAERVTIPEPPATPPRFRVLAPSVASRLRSLARARPADHLLLAVEYARAGAVDEARKELRAESMRNPSRAGVEALLRSLDAPR